MTAGIEIIATSVSFTLCYALAEFTSTVRTSFDATVRLWDSVTGECLKVLAEHQQGPVYALSFSPDGRWFGTGAEDGWVNIYSVKVAYTTIV
jgi:WD40 repeat protein